VLNLELKVTIKYSVKCYSFGKLIAAGEADGRVQ